MEPSINQSLFSHTTDNSPLLLDASWTPYAPTSQRPYAPRLHVPAPPYQPSTHEKINGTTIVASDSMMNFGVSKESLPQVIFSFGTAPEYDP